MRWQYINPLYWVEVVTTALVLQGFNNLSRAVIHEVKEQQKEREFTPKEIYFSTQKDISLAESVDNSPHNDIVEGRITKSENVATQHLDNIKPIEDTNIEVMKPDYPESEDEWDEARGNMGIKEEKEKPR